MPAIGSAVKSRAYDGCMDTHRPPFWAEHVLGGIGGKATRESVRFLHAWAIAEGGEAKWNPLNSTLELPYSTPYNTFVVNGAQFHVWNYVRPLWGVAATILTLSNGLYPRLLGHLQAGTYTAEQLVNDCQAEIARWGTNVQAVRNALAHV